MWYALPRQLPQIDCSLFLLIPVLSGIIHSGEMYSKCSGQLLAQWDDSGMKYWHAVMEACGCMLVQDSVTGEVRGQAVKAESLSGRSPQAAGAAEQLQNVASVSFLTAALMGVALCFHSVLEVGAHIFSSLHPILSMAGIELFDVQLTCC